jgi:RsiW-degrading membrane proteinase PrsW (M82 family)
MPAHFALEACLGLGPVLIFLIGLIWLDSFKLVGFGMVVGMVLLGALAAIASYVLGGAVMAEFHLKFWTYSRYVAPFLEEAVKASIMIWLFARNRIGFMIDATILGLALGAGFGAFENIYYAYVFPEANIGVWIVRGLGTAIMHAGVTALFGITAQTLRERHEQVGVSAYLPGFLLAASVHLIFNQFTHYPLLSAVGTMLMLPLALLFLFDKSEHEAHNWLVHDYESHEQLLEAIRTGTYEHTQAGRFLMTLATRFSDAIVELAFEYIKLHTELVMQAEEILLAREKGEKISIPAKEIRDKFKELHGIERKIGPTTMLVFWPHLKFSRRELFELHRLEHVTG